jgi:ribosomal protein S18 acetylase RimI-like enzyme
VSTFSEGSFRCETNPPSLCIALRGSLLSLDVVKLRAPNQSDLPALRTLLCSNGWEHRLGDSEWLAQLIASSRALVAIEGVEVVGFARAVTDGLSNGYLSMVVVDREHRHKGIGSRLVLEIMGTAPGVTWVLRASRPGAREFFGTLGFRPSAEAMELNRESRRDI